jgi:hypothetical protein
MTKVSHVEHRRLRRRLHVVLAAQRPKGWDADEVAAQLNGWTVERRRFGTRVYRDPRFDTASSDVRSCVQSGRWT